MAVTQGFRPVPLMAEDGQLVAEDGALECLFPCYVINIPFITAAAFSVNPVLINQQTVLTATVDEQTKYLDADLIYSNEIYSGEV